MAEEMAVVRTRWAAVVAAVLAAAVAGGCGGDDMPPPAIEPVPPPAADAPDAPDTDQSEPGALDLPKRGNPVVWVRRDAKVDLLDRPDGKVIGTVREETEFGSPTVFSVQGVRGDWAAVPTPFFENGRLAWVRLDSRKLNAGRVDWEVEVDLSDFQATLLRRGRPVRTFDVSVGMPEAETPTGRFAVTDTFRGGLNAAYGCCAVALTARQTRLPSGWLGGDRIAIHGTSGPLRAAVSNGCVRADDADVSELVDKVPPGTPVVIRQ